MSREIKFRAWQKKYKEMYEVNCIDWEAEFVWVKYYDDDREEWFSREEHFADLELMQYTGLKDKNGIEIYEGDKIFDGSNNYYVEFKHGMFKPICYASLDNECNAWGYKVIGNIYENPELLEANS